MYPDLFGISNFSYTLCMIVGILLAIVFEILYLKRQKTTFNGFVDFTICACFAVAVGVIFSIIFESAYESIEAGKFVLKGGMTFYGGLIGGAGGFLLTYYLMRKNINFKLSSVLFSAPIAITLAHSIGRVGCFLAGCCYGRPTDSWIGLECANGLEGVKVIPTQLIEAIFLMLICIIMLVLLLKFKFKYNFVIYLGSYSIFRFVIEFYRYDERGKIFVLSPSQIISIIMFVMMFASYFLIRKSVQIDEKK